MRKLVLMLSWLAVGVAHGAYTQSYEKGLREMSVGIGAELERHGPQVGTVLDLNGLDGSITQLGKLVAQDLFDQLVSDAPSVTWIDPSRRDFIIQENQLAADRLMDPATQKRLGKLLGLSMIVTGTLTELGESARIQLRAVEIETARVIGSASITVQLSEPLIRLNSKRAFARARGNGDSNGLEEETEFSNLPSGAWVGEMRQAGFSPFPVRLDLTGFEQGAKCGSISHASLNCSGTLRCISKRQSSFVVEQVIEIGVDRCVGGTNYLVVNDDGTMLRIWIDPRTGREGARGVLTKMD